VIGVASLIKDITERRQAEEERLRLQDEIIRVQQAALAELSTPVIPISDDIIVMPLIGALDSQRAQAVLEALLQGVATSRARVAILDITGVPVVDTQVANALLHAGHAVQLLGAQVLLTGIRPEVAQTLVGLGMDMRGVITRSTLQSGITYALSTRQ
jgi:rsbT co-antagonist protein RsbR